MTKAEERRLAFLERAVEESNSNMVKAYVRKGTALREIRDSKLYKENYKTFERYCKERWNLQRDRAYDLIKAADTFENLSEISDILPTVESHARELAKLATPELQAEAWEAAQDIAADEDGKVTAEHVRQSVDDIMKSLPKRPKNQKQTPKMPKHDSVVITRLIGSMSYLDRRLWPLLEGDYLEGVPEEWVEEVFDEAIDRFEKILGNMKAARRRYQASKLKVVKGAK